VLRLQGEKDEDDVTASQLQDSLDARICAAIHAAETIQKDRTNVEQNYSFASSDVIVRDARALLRTVGVSASWRKARHTVEAPRPDWRDRLLDLLLDRALRPDSGDVIPELERLVELFERAAAPDILDPATGAGTIELEIYLWSPVGSRVDQFDWPLVIGRRKDGGVLKALDKAIKSGVTTAIGEYFRGLLCLDRGGGDEADSRGEEGSNPVRQARRDTEQREQRGESRYNKVGTGIAKPAPKPAPKSTATTAATPPPLTEPHGASPREPAPNVAPPDDAERLARASRNGKIGALVKQLGGRAAASPIVGLEPEHLDDLKSATQDVQENAIAALQRELARRIEAGTAPGGAHPPEPPAQPAGPPEGSKEWFASRAAAKGAQ